MLKKTTHEFQRYAEKTLTHERFSTSRRQSNSRSLTSALVQTSNNTKQFIVKGEQIKLDLIDKIFDNIFAYNFASHETTINAIATTLILLATYSRY